MKLAGEVAVDGPGRGIGRDRVHAGQGRSEVALIARTAAEIQAAAQPIRAGGDRPRLCPRHRRSRGGRARLRRRGGRAQPGQPGRPSRSGRRRKRPVVVGEPASARERRTRVLHRSTPSRVRCLAVGILQGSARVAWRQHREFGRRSAHVGDAKCFRIRQPSQQVWEYGQPAAKTTDGDLAGAQISPRAETKEDSF